MRRNIAIFILVAIFSFTLGILIPLRANVENDRPSSAGVKRIPPFEETRELLDIIKIWKATKELNLTPEQLQIFIPKFNQFEEAKRKYYTERRNLLDQIRKLVNSDNLSGDQVQQLKELLRKLRNRDDRFVQDIRRIYEDLNSDLTVVQQGKLALFLENYRWEIGRILKQLKEIARSRKR